MGNKVRVSEIASFLGSQYWGGDFELDGVSSLENVTDNTLVFSKNALLSFPKSKRVLALVPHTYKVDNEQTRFSVIKVANPRLEFARIVTKFFVAKPVPGVCNTTRLGENCSISETVRIGSHCVIGNNVTICSNSIINNHVIVADNVRIGENCYIKSGSVIGEDGFGFDFDENKTPIRIPHVGRVIIGNNVEIGAKNTIARGTIGDTVIEDGVKIDDQVHIAHNCRIGKNSIITACAEISGSVEIGEKCWLAPNCTIINKIKIGNNVLVGIGALIIKDLPDNTKYMGLEALKLRDLKKIKMAIAYGCE